LSISEKLNSLNQVKSDIKNAVEAKGVDLTDIPFTEYATKIAEITTGDFPGYELKTGELCSLAAKSGTANGGLTQTLSMPVGCIPVCVTLTGNFKVNSGKGESPGFHLWVKDNNNKVYYNAQRPGGSGYIESGGSTIVLNPLGAYDGDLVTAATITSIKIEAANGSWSLISDYAVPKMAVTMWLEAKA
jgi:hypothetical protein